MVLIQKLSKVSLLWKNAQHGSFKNVVEYNRVFNSDTYKRNEILWAKGMVPTWQLELLYYNAESINGDRVMDFGSPPICLSFALKKH